MGDMSIYELRAAEMLDERLNIINMIPESGPADEANYRGMVHMLRALGYDMVIKDGKHVVFDTKTNEEDEDDE